MVKAIINIDDRTNRVLNIVKAKYGLKDKSSAIELVTKQYETELLEPELKPEYIDKAKKIMAQDAVDVGTVANLRERLGI
jgi:hypothetical protein